MKKLIMAAVLSMAIVTPCHAETTCHDLVMSYIIHDQDPPQEPGDILYCEDGTEHKLASTTGYCEGVRGSHGDRMRKGYVAFTPESYGCAMEIYKAIPTESGYELGEYLGLYEIKDCGYGRSTGQGKSRVRSDKKNQGTIEAGLSVDRYAPTLQECREWMKATNGMVFIRIIEAKG